MLKLKAKSWKDLIIHVILAIILFVLFVLGVFKVFLPFQTNHGESITVPDIVGMHIDEVSAFLSGKQLRFQVTIDSGYSPDELPLTVLKQFPKPEGLVKEGRKIYITLNSKEAPLVKLPDLRTQSLKNAILHFRSLGLKIGQKKYVQGSFLNTIKEFSIDGKVIAPGEFISKGSVVDVTLENGLGQQSFQAPNVIGLDFESAEVAIVGSGLELGEVIQETSDSLAGTVIKQIPSAKNRVKVGQIINLWVSAADSTSQSGSILDNNENE